MSELRKAIYSGPNRSGICKCGHRWDQHHLCMVVRPGAEQTDGGIEYYLPCECEAFGVNEDGGKDKDGNDHCFGYVDSNETSSN